ncbi:hypothetical protein CYY_003573 [Polysphondylium violaceum]|uniref:Mitochondrial substrate carrier family protein n=1 Tax=Polysphondylium violaceum TaxID=133409 RepID=A0A8J4PUJ5_9MYCE|nr:hypothetical protein CYY_003573 [Polysphondylium violaceum]
MNPNSLPPPLTPLAPLAPLSGNQYGDSTNNNNNNNNNNTNIPNDSNKKFLKRGIDEQTIGMLMLASIVGGIVTSAVVTPLDVVKTRLQTQVDKHHIPSSNSTIHNANKVRFKGTLDAFSKIYKHEGIFTLWRGLAPSLLMTIPSTTIYFTSYEFLKEKIYILNKDQGYYTVPLIAGTIARVISATITSPLELIRTNSQGVVTENHKRLNSITLFKDIIKNVGVKGLWRGLSPTLLRDVPFSALYWANYEVIKAKMMISRDPSYTRHTKSPFLTTFVAGATSGTIAAVVTTPIDVIKTRIQMTVQQSKVSTSASGTKPPVVSTSAIYHFKEIIKQEGWQGLTKGMVPRVAKVSPACAIMISTFEWIKSLD